MKQTEYHVGAGLCGIYAGRLDKKGEAWVDKSDVTDEALLSVAQYMLDTLKCKNIDTTELHGFDWKMSDGKILKMRVALVKEQSENG